MKDSMPQRRQWVEISVELDQHLQDPLANFLTELGAEGVILDEEIINPLTGKVNPVKRDLKLMRAYLNATDQTQHKIESLDRYLKSLAELHSLKDTPQMTVKIIHEEDWHKKWQRFFTTTRIGRHIIVKPSWELFIPEKGDIVIDMDPGMAFGTGTHATTRMCLEAIEKLTQNRTPAITSMLDVGIGSGILSIAAAKLGVPKTVGIDVDPLALGYAQKNIDKNRVTDQVELRHVSLEKIEGTFDLIVANILSEILLKLRKDLFNHLADNGILILSGIMVENRLKLKRKFTSRKLALVTSYSHTDWICMVLQKVVA
jgi:ribosomal protein L11 methyltransferase